MSKHANIETLKKLVRSVLMSSKEGVSDHNFLRDFKDLAQCELKPGKYGFRGVRDLLQSMPDVVRISCSYDATTYHVVESKETAHIKSLVARQNTKKKRGKKRTSYFKCSKPHHTKYVNPLMQPQVPRLRSLQKLAIRPIERHLDQSRSKTWSADRVTTRPMSKDIAVPRNQRRTSLRRPARPSVSPVTLNRVKSFLGKCSNGLRFPTLQGSYRNEYGVDLPDTFLHTLKSSNGKGLPEVEEYQSDGKKTYMLYPPDRVKKSSSEVERKAFTINSDTSEMSISATIKNRLKTLLHLNNHGCTFSELKNLYRSKHGSISDSIFHGLECGQIKDVARVEKRCMGNREYITFFPIDSVAAKNTPVKIPENMAERGQGFASHSRVTNMKAGNAVDAIGMVNLSTPEKRANAEERLKISISRTVRARKVECLTPDDKIKYPKYRAVSNSGKNSNPLELCMEPNSLHYGTITHVCDSMLFYVKVTGYDALMERMKAKTETQKQSARPVKAGSGDYVLANNKRGKVLSVFEKHADIYFLDVGHVSRIEITDLVDMPGNLLEVPCLAVLCKFDGVDSENDKVRHASRETLRKYIDSEVILDVASNQSEQVDEKLVCVHMVQCYVRTERKNLNLEVIESLKSFKTANIEESSDIIRRLNMSSSTASSSSYDTSDNEEVASSLEVTLGTEDGSISDSKDASSEQNYHQQEMPALLSDSPNKDTSPGKDLSVILPKFPCYQGKLGKMMVVEVTRVITPGQFYMLPVERLAHLTHITTAMAEYFSKESECLSPCKPSSGDKRIYAAVCETHSLPIWRRVEVTHIKENRACVYLVDLGQVDCVPLHSLKRLPRDITLFPKLAITGRLGGIVIKQFLENGGLKPLKQFHNLTVGRQLIAHVMDCSLVNDSLVFDVSLFCTDEKKCRVCINDVMVEDRKVSKYISVT